MGWGRMLLLGNWGQQMDIDDQGQELAVARARLDQKAGKDRSQDEQIAELAQENENLRLYVFGLIRLLESKGAITADEVAQLVRGIEEDDDDDSAPPNRL